MRITGRKIEEEVDQILGNCLIDELERNDVINEIMNSESFRFSLSELLADVEYGNESEIDLRINSDRAISLLKSAKQNLRNMAECRISARDDFNECEEKTPWIYFEKMHKDLPDNVLNIRHKSERDSC